MSVDRMDFILGNEGTLPDGSNSQGIFPETYFTCSGTIQSWIFGAQWIGASELLQLQIWRAVSGNDDLYILVESTTVNITEENETQLYHYPSHHLYHFNQETYWGYSNHMVTIAS